MSVELDADEQALIEDLLDGGRSGDDVRPDECREFRERVDDGESPRSIAASADESRSGSTISDHAYGRCRHSEDLVGPEATPSTQAAERRRQNRVTRAGCQRIRALAQRGDAQAAISRDLDIGEGTVHRHLLGKCKAHASPEHGDVR